MSQSADSDTRRFESLMAPMADLVGLGYWLFEPGSTDIFVSASFHKLLGYSTEGTQVTPDACLERVHPKDKPQLKALLGTEPPGTPAHHRLRIRHENGIWHWFEVKSGPLPQGCRALTFLDISEFKEIEAAAVDSQLRYHSLYSTSPLAIILWNKEGQITEWNRRAESTFGWLSHEVVGRPIHRLLFSENERELFSQTVKDLARGEGNGRCTTNNLTKQGQILRCHWSNVLLRSNQGTLIGIMSLVEDYTESWAMECEIRRNEAMYRALVETSPDAIFLLDTQGSISMANYQAARLHGVDDLGELVGTSFSSLLPEGKESEFWTQVLANPDDHIGLIGSDETHLRRADGSLFDGEISYTATINHEGHASGLVVVGRDITQRKKIQQELRNHRDHLEQLVLARTAALEAAQETLSQIIEGCPVPIFVVDTHKQVTHWNHASEVALGAKAESLLGSQDQWKVFYDTRRPVLADLVVEGRSDEIPLYYGDKTSPSPLVDKGFQGIDYFPSLQRWYQFTAAPVKNRQGEVIAAIETLVDITASKAAEQTLIEARQLAESAAKMKAEFLANMSHEIRTPLNAVMGLTRLLRQTTLDARQQEYAEKIFNASRMLLALLNDLLDFSKIEAGQLALENAEFQLDELLDNVATVVQTPARDKGLEIHFICSPEVPCTLKGDSLRLTQVMVNLLSNAIKFTSHGHVAVKLSVLQQDAGEVCLQVAVEDTGIGLTPDQQSRLFQAFSQADTSTSRKFGGTGLGLIICRRLVGLMGGSIHLDSTAGVGSTFTFNARLGKAPKTATLTLPRFEGQRALIVDDHPLARSVLCEQLGVLGFKCLAVGTATEFKKALLEPFDWIFLDWLLPDTSGHELAKQARSKKPQAKLLLVTATDPQAVREAIAAPIFDAILTKPLIFSRLAQTLAGLCGQAVPQEPTKTPHQALLGLKLLVVDDIATNRFIASELLRGLGANVEQAESGEQALTLIGESDQHFDVVLMDVQMPEVDGVETTEMIKAIPALKDLPVIAMTAHAMESEINRCKACGMVDYIGKPIDPELLVEVLRRWGYDQNGQPRISKRSLPQPPGCKEESKPGVKSADQLPGIDLAEGLRRLMNKRDLFDRVAKDFYARFKDEAALIHEAVRADDRSSAERMVHTIKGLAGSLGAKDLQQAAADLEEAIYNGQTDFEALQLRFSDALQTVLAGLKAAYSID